MSITKDFESHGAITPNGKRLYPPGMIDTLLAHARELEEKLEWALDTIDDCHGSYFEGCPTCEKAKEARELLDA